MLLEGKRLVITGVLTDDSIAWHTARIAQEQGASLVLTGFGRGLRLTERSAQRLPVPVDVFELDINDQAHMAALVDELERRWGAVDGALHAIAYAPEDALGGRFLETPAESAGTAFLTSAFSYKTLAVGLRPLMVAAGGGSLVTLDFDNTQAWPAYDWMGVAKAALQAVTRYLARDLGVGPDQGQRSVGRAVGHGGGQGDPRVRPVRRGVAAASAIGLGRRRSDPGGADGGGAAVRLGAGHQR